MVVRVVCLNHLQGEYWIATVDPEIWSSSGLNPSLNHLQGEYWIATLPIVRLYRRGYIRSESSPGRILDCDPPPSVSVMSVLSESESSPGRILDCDPLYPE